MEFRLLGTVEAIRDGSPVALGRRRERTLLALLLLEAGKVVATERLIELLFADDTPGDPRKALQVHVSRLRRALAPAGDAVRLVSQRVGYAIHCDSSLIDVHRFTRLVDQARQCDNVAERAGLLREALAMWRGPALPDLAAEQRKRVCARLDEAYLTAIELRVEADLAIGGRDDELIAELADLTAKHPTRERLIAARMLALYRAGRKAEALELYHQTARKLVEEFGVDPGTELRDLHTAILRDAPDLAGPAARTAAARVEVRPAQLPADLATFTGRETELEELLRLPEGKHQTAVITAIDGMAGVGKTTLAVHAAHRLAPHYPDGQLFLDLQGFTEGVAPVAPAEALSRMLNALGVPVDQGSSDVAERAALFRSVLADKRVLILLDNAESEAQVEPLLPAAPGCLVLVTSRRRLPGLDDANLLSLDLLPREDAVRLFTEVVGVQRLAGVSADTVAKVVTLCGHLPLAIRIAAARLRSRPSWTVTDLIGRLTDQRHRLAELQAGRRSVAAAVDLSYDHLTAEQQRMFRLFGLHPGPDIDPSAAAALAGTTPYQARRLLDDLLDAHLLQQRSHDRYHAHDLLRAYAADICAKQEPEANQHAALHRLFNWYLHATIAAMKVIRPRRKLLDPDVPVPETPLPEFGSVEDAMVWLDTERHNLLATVHEAAARGWHNHAWKLPDVLYRFFHIQGYYDDWMAANQIALAATRALGSVRGEAEILNKLGLSYVQAGRFRDALPPLERSLKLHRELRDPRAEALTSGNLGIAYWQSGRRAEAIEQFQRAYELVAKDDSSEAAAVLPSMLNNLGKAYLRQRRYEEAEELLRKSVELRRQHGDDAGLAACYTNLGTLNTRLGRYTAAFECFQNAIDLQQTAGRRDDAVGARLGLGELHLRRGDYAAAREAYQLGLLLSRQIGHQETGALNGMGELCYATGEYAEAADHHGAALALAERFGDRDEQARAHHGLGRSLGAAGDYCEALRHLTTALDMFTELEAPEAEEVRVSLAELGEDVPAMRDPCRS